MSLPVSPVVGNEYTIGAYTYVYEGDGVFIHKERTFLSEVSVHDNTKHDPDYATEQALNSHTGGNKHIDWTNKPADKSINLATGQKYKINDVSIFTPLTYTALTSNSNATLDCSNFRETAKATWAINANFTLTLTNVTNGQAGDIIIVTTGECDVTISSTLTKKYIVSEDYPFTNDKVTLPAGRYHLCFTAGDGWIDFNIAEYE